MHDFVHANPVVMFAVTGQAGCVSEWGCLPACALGSPAACLCSCSSLFLSLALSCPSPLLQPNHPILCHPVEASGVRLVACWSGDSIVPGGPRWRSERALRPRGFLSCSIRAMGGSSRVGGGRSGGEQKWGQRGGGGGRAVEPNMGPKK